MANDLNPTDWIATKAAAALTGYTPRVQLRSHRHGRRRRLSAIVATALTKQASA
jgi:hypothetical protein